MLGEYVVLDEAIRFRSSRLAEPDDLEVERSVVATWTGRGARAGSTIVVSDRDREWA